MRPRGASATRVAQYTEGLITPEFYSVVRKNETLGVLTVGREARNGAAVAEAMEEAEAVSLAAAAEASEAAMG